MDWRKLVKDRRVQLGGVAAAAGAGLFVWYRGRGKTSTAGSSDQSSGDGSGSVVAGGFPSTADSDAATWMGQYQQQVNDQLEQFQQSIESLQTTLSGLQSGNTGSGSGNVGPPRVTLPIESTHGAFIQRAPVQISSRAR